MSTWVRREAVILLAAGFLGSTAHRANATTYSDSTGDLFNNGFGHLDITSVEVTADGGGELMFRINLNGDPVATDWGKYMIAIHTGAGGDPVGNGWGRPISYTPGMNY